MEAADAADLLEMIGLLGKMRDPAGVPPLFRCLAHPVEAVREQAKQVVHLFGWGRVTAAIEDLARHGDGERVGAILDGLAAFEARRETVALLDRLSSLLKGDLRTRTIFLLERKQQGLEFERVAELFRESRSPYQIQKALGQGLFTAAYLARDESTELDVVIRVLRPEFAQWPQVRAQFLDLGKQAMKLVHHGLVLTREVRSFPDRHLYFAVRDYVDGVTLHKVLESGRAFTPDQIVQVLGQILQALAPIHAAGIAHGSIKPSNVFLCGADRVILGDLALPARGIVLNLDRLAYDYRYAPPEMFRQDGTIGPWSDFYALGCLAYELACGAPPFLSDNHFELAGMHGREPVEPPSRRGSRLGPSGDPLILRLLAKSPSDRLADRDSALRALGDVRDGLRPRAPAQEPAAPLLGDQSLVRYTTDSLVSIVSLTFTADPRSDGDTPLGLIAVAAGPGSAEDTSTTDGETARGRVVTHLDDVPTQFGRYVMVRLIGQGGLGAVYLARDESLGREVAIKLNRLGSLASPEARARFQREAMLVARLSHPNIVAIYDVGEKDGFTYTVLEYVDGGNLRQQLDRGPWPHEEAARLVAILARAVDHAHSLGIVHRDLKPSNILLTKDEMPKISDFGLAKLLGEQVEDAVVTGEGVILGTPAYMAPEQAIGEIQAIGPAADIYALGTILYELLAGRRPFLGGTPHEMFMHLQVRDPTPPSRFQPKLPRDLDMICLKCLQKEPQRRHPTAGALADDLERILAGVSIMAQRPGRWERLSRRLGFKKSPRPGDRPGP
jgi:serine/threonine protein kinase